MADRNYAYNELCVMGKKYKEFHDETDPNAKRAMLEDLKWSALEYSWPFIECAAGMGFKAPDRPTRIDEIVTNQRRSDAA
jgi:hypothetical protein